MSRGRVLMPRCAIDGIEATVADTARSFARHSHEHFGIGVVSSGGQRSASGRGPVEARAGDTITVNPGEVHDGSPFDERGRAWRMLYVEPALFYDAGHELGAASSTTFELEQPVMRDPLLAGLFDKVFFAAVDGAPQAAPQGRTRKSSEGGAAQIDALARDEALLAFLAHVIARHTTIGARHRALETSGLAGSVARAKARIDDDPAAALTLAGLAAEAGVSRFQLLRGFARETGLPPHAYLIQRRLSLARKLIARGAALADAAAAAGFADQSHMTRAFVRLLGVTPATYAAAVR